jgi:TonB family protein
MFAPFDVRPAPTSEGLTLEEAMSVGKFEMMHCKVELYLVNMNGMAWVWFACSNGEHLRGVFLIDGRELATSRKMLREKHSAPAAGAEVPAQYRGLWCEARDGTYYRCREATSEGYQHIHRDRIKLSEEGDCHITAVTPTTKGHRLRVYCPPGVLPVPPEHVNLRLDARGRLHLDQEFVPVPVAPVPSLDSQSIAVWKAAIVTKIDEKKHYPEAAVAYREHGVARVFFAIDREGRLLESRIVQSSGSANLDAAALDTLKRVEPFPPPPDSLKGERIDLTIPFRFDPPRATD